MRNFHSLAMILLSTSMITPHVLAQRTGKVVSESNQSGRGASQSGVPTRTTAPGPGGSATNAGSDTSSDNSMGKVMNIAQGAMNGAMAYQNYTEYTTSCATTPPGCQTPKLVMAVAHGAMAIANVAQAGANSKASKAGNASALDFGSGPSFGGGPEDTNDSALLAAQAQLDKDLDKLRKMGVNISGDRTKATVKGKTFDLKKLLDKAGFVAAGGSPADYDAAIALNDKVAKEALGKALPERKADEGEALAGGGGAGVPMDSTIVIEEEDMSGSLAGQKGLSRDLASQNAALIASDGKGPFKNYFGDKIGTGSDNIFEMIRRRYLVKDKQEVFIKEESPAAKGI